MKFLPFYSATYNRGQIHSQRATYERVLNEIGNAIMKSASNLENTEAILPELIDYVIDDETEFVELLLGTAFVLCQAYISHVVSHMKRFHDLAKRQGIQLHTTTGGKKDILKFGCEADNFSTAEIVDAFANYFKHRDEWNAIDWEKLDNPRQKATAKIIQSLGAEWGSNGNLRQGSRVLGNTDFTNPIVFLDKLEQWYINLTDAYCSEFERAFV